MAERSRCNWSHDRFLYLFGELTDECARDAVARLLQERHRELLLIVNSDGGSSFNALALVNAIKLHGRVDTLCIGVALSGGADCLAAGRRRYILPNTIAMIHQVSLDLGHEFVANLVKNAQFLDRLNSTMLELLARDTRQPVEKLQRDIATDLYLFGQEIIDYGLADELLDPAELPAFPTPPRLPLHGDGHEPRRRLPPQRRGRRMPR